MVSSYRKLIIDRIVPESASAKSFYLVPADGLPPTPYLPGQHLPLRLTIPGQDEPVHRFYTISDCYRGQPYYRLTIKKELPPGNKPELPPGLSSTHFNDVVRVSDTIEAKPPSGQFWLDLKLDHPIVLIAGGIGITPLLSMLNAVVLQQPQRPVWFFFALRNSRDHVFKDHLRDIAARHPNIRLLVSYDQAEPTDVPGVDYDRVGRVDMSLLSSVLPTLKLDYYICGPAPMMKAVVGGLQGAGVAQDQIKTESFGPAGSPFRSEDLSVPALTPTSTAPATDWQITFRKSGKTVAWDPKARSLWHFAEKNGIEISSGCLYGDCGTCLTRLVEGRVAYLHKTGAQPDAGSCLPCSCKPNGPITIEA